MTETYRPRSVVNNGYLISPAAVELGRAMERWQREHGRQPDCRDVLRVIKRLGYRLESMPVNA